MKIRKHKNNRTFLITFSTRPASRTETHLCPKTNTTHKFVSRDIESPVRRVWATGSCKQSVMRAFLTGRDAGNLTTIIHEATPLVTKFDGVLNICPV